jgi:hypothetical protein
MGALITIDFSKWCFLPMMNIVITKIAKIPSVILKNVFLVLNGFIYSKIKFNF